MQRIKLIYYLVFIVLIGSSCKTYKKYTYLRNIPLTGDDQVIKKDKPTYQIQPDDILYIRVITPDQTMGEIFNPFPGGGTGVSGGSSTGGANMYLYGYTVSDKGYINIPIIDSVKVQGLTLEAVKRKISKEANKYLQESQVIVKMARFKFTLLGEVAAPGVQTVYENNVNIIEAISYGGGITYNGDRQTVLIIRSTREGNKTFQIDLTDNEIMKSDLYYIMPNDIIYVKPRRTTAVRQETSNFLFAISALSSVLTTALLIWRLDL